MFPKKNNQDTPLPSEPPMQSASGPKSLFAPGLNPSATPIDFFTAPGSDFAASSTFPSSDASVATPPPGALPGFDSPPSQGADAPSGEAEDWNSDDYIPGQAAFAIPPLPLAADEDDDFGPVPSWMQTPQPASAEQGAGNATPLPLAPGASALPPSWDSPSPMPEAGAADWPPPPESMPGWLPPGENVPPDPEPGQDTAAWQPSFLDQSMQVGSMYPDEPPGAETAWQPPPGMDLPKAVPEIYPEEYVSPAPGAMANPDSPEALWNSFRPTAAQPVEDLNISDDDFAGTTTPAMPEPSQFSPSTPSAWTPSDDDWAPSPPGAPVDEIQLEMPAPPPVWDIPAAPETERVAPSSMPETLSLDPSLADWTPPESRDPMSATSIAAESWQEPSPPLPEWPSPLPADSWDAPQPSAMEEPAPDWAEALPGSPENPVFTFEDSVEAPAPYVSESFDMPAQLPSWAEPDASPELSGVESLSASEPDTIIPSTGAAEQTLWENLQGTSLPGAQVPTDPLSSGQFLDNVSGQLYPDDPFGLPEESFAAGGQAFEDAAQFLFPETVGAPLEWMDPLEPEPSSFEDSGQGLLPESAPMDLGPSHQSAAAGALSDMAALPEASADPVTFSTLPELPMPPVEPPAASPESMSVSPPEVQMPPEAPAPKRLAVNENPVVEPSSESLSSVMAEPSAPAVADEASVSPLPAMEMEESVPMPPEMSLSPYEAVGFEEAAPPKPLSLTEPDPDFSPDAVWFPDGELPPPPAAVLPLSQEELARTYDSILGPLPSPMEDSWDAPTGVPDIDDPLQAYFSPPAFDEKNDGMLPDSAMSYGQPSQGLPEQDTPAATPLPGSEHFGSWNLPFDENAGEAAPDSDEEEEAVPVYAMEAPSPDFLDPVVDRAAPQAAEVSELSSAMSESADNPEAAWVAAEPASEPPQREEADAAAPTAPFALGNLEIVSVCPLEGDKRLLLVQSNGTYALMGQVGAQNPDVSVIKIFENNPIAYQKTFTAIQEGQTGNQGMYLAQVGTWHGVISTFQQGILLHTELG